MRRDWINEHRVLAAAQIALALGAGTAISYVAHALLELPWPLLVALFLLVSGVSLIGLVAVVPRWRPDHPSHRYFHGRAIRLPEFIARNGAAEVRDKTFEDCTIIGPAVVMLLADSGVQNCTWDARGLWPVVELPSDELRMTGSVRFSSCQFRRCRFLEVGLVGGPTIVQTFSAGSSMESLKPFEMPARADAQATTQPNE
jgi:hypothetical protein